MINTVILRGRIISDLFLITIFIVKEANTRDVIFVKRSRHQKVVSILFVLLGKNTKMLHMMKLKLLQTKKRTTNTQLSCKKNIEVFENIVWSSGVKKRNRKKSFSLRPRQRVRGMSGPNTKLLHIRKKITYSSVERGKFFIFEVRKKRTERITERCLIKMIKKRKFLRNGGPKLIFVDPVGFVCLGSLVDQN